VQHGKNNRGSTDCSTVCKKLYYFTPTDGERFRPISNVLFLFFYVLNVYNDFNVFLRRYFYIYGYEPDNFMRDCVAYIKREKIERVPVSSHSSLGSKSTHRTIPASSSPSKAVVRLTCSLVCFQEA